MGIVSESDDNMGWGPQRCSCRARCRAPCTVMRNVKLRGGQLYSAKYLDSMPHGCGGAQPGRSIVAGDESPELYRSAKACSNPGANIHLRRDDDVLGYVRAVRRESGEGSHPSLTVYLLLRSRSPLRMLSSRGIVKKKKPTRRMVASLDWVSGGLMSPYPTVLRHGRKREGTESVISTRGAVGRTPLE